MAGYEEGLFPGRSYDFKLTVKDQDYSNNVYGVRFVNSMATAYMMVILDLHVIPGDMITDEIFGQDPITLEMKNMGTGDAIIEELSWDLMFVRTNYSISITEESLENEGKGSQADAVPVSILTVVRPSYTIMTWMINMVFGYDFAPKKMQSLIEDVVNETPGNLEFDTEGINEEEISQVLMLPTTLYKNLKYIDNTFGIYDGPAMIYCAGPSGNDIFIKNLQKEIKRAEKYTIFHLATQTKTEKEIIEKEEQTMEGKSYYTHSDIDTEEVQNPKWNSIGNNMVHIVKPNNTLSHKIEHDLTTISTENGLVDEGPALFPDVVINRTKYYTEHSGMNYSETFAKSMISKKIFNMATVKITLERSVRIEPLLEIGIPIRFKTKTAEYIDITGKYIVHMTDNTFNKAQGGWEVFTDISLIRSTKLKK